MRRACGLQCCVGQEAAGQHVFAMLADMVSGKLSAWEPLCCKPARIQLQASHLALFHSAACSLQSTRVIGQAATQTI